MPLERRTANSATSKRSKAKSVAKLGLLSGAALGMSAGEVMATIIDFGSLPPALSWGTNGSASSTLDIGIDSSSQNDLAFFGSAGGMAGQIGIRSPGMGITLNVLANGMFVTPIAPGATIGTQTSSSWAQPMMSNLSFLRVRYNMMSSAYVPQGSFSIGTPQYFGFQFSYNMILVNGWAQVLIGGSTLPTQIQLVAGAFENSGQTIQAGQTAVPEPGSGALLALGLGALGVQSMRRRARERNEALPTSDVPSPA